MSENPSTRLLVTGRSSHHPLTCRMNVIYYWDVVAITGRVSGSAQMISLTMGYDMNLTSSRIKS
uniref:Uncharacterized protein n=1 Tax=viral metagenome TaxID=1070528 RepID=A0A6C0BMH6_9ZZZZ